MDVTSSLTYGVSLLPHVFVCVRVCVLGGGGGGRGVIDGG